MHKLDTNLQNPKNNRAYSMQLDCNFAQSLSCMPFARWRADVYTRYYSLICMVISIRYMSWFTYLEENKQLSRYKAQEYMSAKYKVQYTEYKVQSKKYMSTNYMSTKFGFIIAHELECYIIHCQIICSSSSIHSQMKNSILVNFALSIQPLLAGMAQW